MVTRGDVKDWLVAQVKNLKPSFLGKTAHFNFITAHYLYIVGQLFVGSILLYASGNGAISYIDSLLFSSGASTQSGLNPIDVNMLNTFQQAVLYLQAMMCSPITVNTCVVFLRLYWFERRLMHIVKEARRRRGTLSKSRAKSVFERTNDAEQGVNVGDIRVMHGRGNTRITNDGILLPPVSEESGQNGSGSGPSLRLPDEDVDPLTPQPVDGRPRDIKFAATVKRSDAFDDDPMNLPTARTTEEHLAILERQRNEEETLRIPGPRDVERGMAPQRVDNSSSSSSNEDNEPETNHGAANARRTSVDSRHQAPQPQLRPQTIMIEEPTKPQKRDEMAEDLEVIKNVFSPVYTFRTPRIFRSKNEPQHGGQDDEARGRQRQTPPQSSKRQLSGLRRVLSHDQATEGTPYLSWTPTIGRNSNFAGMSEEQRDEVGGIEYRSLKALVKVLIGYFVGFSLLGVVCLLPWIRLTDQYGSLVDAVSQSRTWWGFFMANSAFMDLGFTLTPDSMISFNTAVFPLLLMSFLIIIGNTGFPVMLRFMIWFTSRIIPQESGLWEELRFLLDHPRRCFTLLFPSGATWWLFGILILLNGIDLIFFIVLDLASGPVHDMPTGIKILNGVFQAASTRTAGFASVNISQLHPAVQTSYLIMMYISIFPIAISVRRTNVYEESSLGVYGSSGMEEEGNNGSDLSYVGSHLRRQLSFDLWYIATGFFLLSLSEGDRLQKGDFSMFAVLFELVSAYGTVGLSLGYTGINASLVSQFTPFGKVVIIAMQIRGRHRGLPYGLDRAVLLPGDSRNKNEEALAEAKLHDARLARRMSGISTGTHFTGVHYQGTPSVHRMRSRSIDRTNSNILSQLLHPGPHHTPPHHHNAATFTSMRSMSTPHLDDLENDHLGVGRHPMRRAETLRAEALGQAPSASPRPPSASPRPAGVNLRPAAGTPRI
ncbi:potassium transporter 1 [Gaeumannomyces tritici R3-111a-1]|uniref:Potassium transport protein n=1 Tax=Gaeumannomyces tritici (strain R3-111a-1) TaxID=644352 RepID=J3NR25_GAET3|nr:potassium transporter 1 [Gaeumannomyces tritici R3-111a-1]EJT78631.1 potassium transporter 1 [Gaeumannomyces tritici R3-111a-1]